MQHSPVAQSKRHGADSTRLQRPRGCASANLELQWMWAVIQPLKLVLSYKHLTLDNLCGLLVSQRSALLPCSYSSLQLNLHQPQNEEINVFISNKPQCACTGEGQFPGSRGTYPLLDELFRFSASLGLKPVWLVTF